jgi:hypothetical protein
VRPDSTKFRYLGIFLAEACPTKKYFLIKFWSKFW